MAKAKHFLVLGLGSFGATLARRLAEIGCRVTGVDASERDVLAIKDILYEPVVGDATDRQTLKNLPVASVDAVFISLGEHIEQSILAALHTKELGARYVVAKAVSEDHGKILERLGVERIVFPEAEIARQLAEKSTWTNVIDFLQIDPDYSIIELAVPASLSGKRLAEADVRRKYDIFIMGVKDMLHGQMQLVPDGEFVLSDDQVLLVIGKQESLERFRDLK